MKIARVTPEALLIEQRDQARAEARAAALEEAAAIARYCTIHDGDDAGWLQCAEYILARLRALIEESP